jgi:acetyltransferase-like isoleucine patch superfamily enzyme
MRLLLKRSLLAVALVFALPFILAARAGFLLGSDGLFTASATLLGLVPGKTGSYLRLAFYTGTLASISPDVTIGFGSYFSKRTARVGRRVFIGSYCILGNVEIGDSVHIASGISITSGRHQHGKAGEDRSEGVDGTFERVRIGSHAWIGERAVVMADVGEGCIVGAGSVVVKPVPDGIAAAGNPARPIGKGPETAAAPAAGNG